MKGRKGEREGDGEGGAGDGGGGGAGCGHSPGATSSPVAWSVAGAASPSARRQEPAEARGRGSAGRAGRSEPPVDSQVAGGRGSARARCGARRRSLAVPGLSPISRCHHVPPWAGAARAPGRPLPRSVACPALAGCSSWGSPAETQRARRGEGGDAELPSVPIFS